MDDKLSVPMGGFIFLVWFMYSCVALSAMTVGDANRWARLPPGSTDYVCFCVVLFYTTWACAILICKSLTCYMVC